MKTGVLVLAIIAAVASLSIGLCSGMFLSGLGNLGSASQAAKANDMGSMLMVMSILEFVLALVGGIKAFRNWEVKKKARIAGILLLIGACCSITNTFQALISGVMLLVAAILTFIGGGKQEATKE